MQNHKPNNFSRPRLVKFARRTIFLNLAATAAAIGISAGFNNWQNAVSQRDIIVSLVYSICIGTVVSATITFVVARNFGASNRLRMLKLTATIFATTFAGIVLANVVFAVIGMSQWTKIFALNAGQFWFSITIALGFGFSAYFYELSQTHLAFVREQLRQKELDAARADRLATEAQLASLTSRLHPHFLFNTLNSIAALVREDADLAEKTVERLADLLRYSLDANQSQTVDLQQEIEITIGYLEIERARFGERLRYEIEIDQRFFKQKVPPFALQTLIENSIKHVAAKRPGAIEIKVAARRAGDFLEIEVADDGAGFSSREIKAGHGLDTLQKRFAQIFGDACELQINENANGGSVFFRVPLDPEYELQTASAVSRAAAPARLFS